MTDYEIKTQDTILKITAMGTWATISGTVANTGVNADSDGRKIIAAGTPLKAATTTIRAARDEGIVTTGDGDSPEVILFHDVDVTDGDKTATFLVNGIIDNGKVTISAALKAKLAAYGFSFIG
jgi:hypothetical protein